jgi:thiamine-monophosphate kinase
MAGVDEFGLIRLLNGNRQAAALQASNGVVTGIGDDAAVLSVSPGSSLVVSCDTMVEDIHFTRMTMKHADAGYKAMASAVSDIAAMGARPRFALVSLSAPKRFEPGDLKELYDGLYECAGEYNVMVVGGDTTSAPDKLTVTVTVLGEVEAGRALLRSAARPGDIVFVTGFLGRSAAGLDYLLSRRQDAKDLLDVPSLLRGLIHAHQRPSAQVEAGLLLQETGLCHALNDISDGLAGEAWEIAEASGCSIVLHEERFPVEAALRSYAETVERNPVDWILFGGEDYELVGTVAAKDEQALREAFESRGLHFFTVGEAAAGKPGVQLVRLDGSRETVPKNSYNHFDR